MAKTKAQKISIVEEGKKELKNSKFLVFADFGGTSFEDIKSLRRTLREIGAKFQVIKKRLLKIILKEVKIDLDTKQSAGQMGTIFTKGDISEVAQQVHKFSKDKKNFKMVGGADLLKSELIPAETVIAIGRLPSREILLGQVLGALTGPLRAFMYVLSEKAKRVENK